MGPILRLSSKKKSGVVPFPVVPNEQMGNMDILLENLNITTFMPDNELTTVSRFSVLYATCLRDGRRVESPPSEERTLSIDRRVRTTNTGFPPNIKIPQQRSKVHSTSLNVSAFSCSATHDGWQVITSKLPFSTARVSYFEAKVQSNEDPKGGLAIGILGHMPKGIEVYQLKHKDGS